MKKKMCLISVFITLLFSLSAIEMEEYIAIPKLFGLQTKKYTNICYSQNFGFEFAKPVTNITYSGTARVSFQDYWLDFNIGIANLLQYGGLYGKTAINNKTGDVSFVTAKEFNASQELLYGVGVAIDVPVNNQFSLNFEAGPTFGFAFYVNKLDESNCNFLLGVWGAAAIRFFPDKKYNLICGMDIGYDFLNVALNSKTEQTTYGYNYLAIKPFVGITVKTDSWFKNFK